MLGFKKKGGIHLTDFTNQKKKSLFKDKLKGYELGN